MGTCYAGLRVCRQVAVGVAYGVTSTGAGIT
jgi:hypothetical protein